MAALSLLSATAVAGGHRVVQGTKGGDELTMGAGANRVFARAGDDTVDGGAGNDQLRGGRGDDSLFGGEDDDRLRGGQDNDLLDGGEGDDYLNGGGDGGDKDRIVCGDGHDVVVLGKNDVLLVEVEAAEHPVEEGEALAGDESDEPVLEEPESGDDDGCEKVKGPGAPQACASHGGGCEDPVEEPCVATNRGCEDPIEGEPEPDQPVELPEPDVL